ncbi:hypothetical protein [Plantactinospora soyae]|uniref:Uncharacterized protein n=1 Tax=Plantactinospora soyae TaxID=1544732 RepID=A0A927QWI5_9ACTN|nr:hypothetical protein [Plantactinospora soyae]MBE1485597.1 hypothetical protein [Plantactinospora soyae]
MLDLIGPLSRSLTPIPTPAPTLEPVIQPYYIVSDPGPGPWLVILVGGLLTALGVGAVVLLMMRRKEHESDRNEFESKAASAVGSVRATVPVRVPSLEDEIRVVAATLASTVTQMRQISAKAEAFETEVHDLVRRADAAQAAADLSEDQARKIGLLLGAQTERKLKEEIEKLTAVHNEQMEKSRRSGIRLAIWSAVFGAVAGFFVNLLSSWVMN